MRTAIAIGRGRRLGLQHALLIYRGQGYAGMGEGGVYVTLHDVAERPDGAPQLRAGRPADLGFLRSLAEDLQAAAPTEVLPPHVVCRTPTLVAWWSPARRRPMHFSDHSRLAELAGTVFPHPPLVWKLDGRELYVRALSEDARPAADTPLAVSPYWNTDRTGRVCLGDMRRPERLSVDTLGEWEEGYFGSLFTGPNWRGAHVEGEGGVEALWRELAEDGDAPFPTDRLIDAEETLAEWLGGGGA